MNAFDVTVAVGSALALLVGVLSRPIARSPIVEPMIALAAGIALGDAHHARLGPGVDRATHPGPVSARACPQPRTLHTWEIATLLVLGSVLAHGLTGSAFTRLYARRAAGG